MEPLTAVDRTARVLGVEHHPWPLFTLTLRLEGAYPEVEPGQFVMVLAPTTLEPYLRRAFSVFDLHRGEGFVDLAIHGKVIGPGTAALARCVGGEELAVLGPLGRGFDRHFEGRGVLVAGGVGSAALLLLAEALLREEVEFDWIYGGRSASDLAHGPRFGDLAQASGGSYLATTEDGSEGAAGRVTGPLERLLEQGKAEKIFTCGPDPMMAAVAKLASKYGVCAEAALETPMGCGFGACLGCVVPQVEGGLALCCRVGPVFDTRAVAW